MWTVIQLVVCVLFLLVAAFWIGRLLGKRKYLKLHEEMKALELSFNQLIEDMELASSHNMKVLEKQSEELGELLTIADKKILRANDFLQELDNACADLKKKSSSLGSLEPVTESAGDRKFRQEFAEALDEIQSKIQANSKRIQANSRKIEEIEEEPSAEPVVESINYAKIKSMIDEEVTRQISRQLSFLELGVNPKNERVVPIRSAVRESFVAQVPSSVSGSGMAKVSELKSASIDDGARLPARKADMGPEPDFPEPPPGSPVFEVLKMAENGVTSPQIARTLGMGKGEIELILKMYGSRINMRSVV